MKRHGNFPCFPAPFVRDCSGDWQHRIRGVCVCSCLPVACFTTLYLPRCSTGRQRWLSPPVSALIDKTTYLLHCQVLQFLEMTEVRSLGLVQCNEAGVAPPEGSKLATCTVVLKLYLSTFDSRQHTVNVSHHSASPTPSRRTYPNHRSPLYRATYFSKHRSHRNLASRTARVALRPPSSSGHET